MKLSETENIDLLQMLLATASSRRPDRKVVAILQKEVLGRMAGDKPPSTEQPTDD